MVSVVIFVVVVLELCGGKCGNICLGSIGGVW